MTHINNRWLWVSAPSPPSAAQTDRRSLRGLPICHATIPKAWPPFPPLPHQHHNPQPSQAVRLRQHRRSHSIHPLSDTLSWQDRLQVLLRKGMGLQGGLIQSTLVGGWGGGREHTHTSFITTASAEAIQEDLLRALPGHWRTVCRI